jgi:hypothetical protein
MELNKKKADLNMSLLAGVKVISKFILNKGVKDAVKKFGL